MEAGMETFPLLGTDTMRHETWDFVQQSLGCCGIVNYTDWSAVMTDDIPTSCTTTTRDGSRVSLQ